MSVSTQVWVITCVVILGLFVFDFFAHVRVPHEPTFRESAIWSTVYITLAVLFGFLIWWQWGAQYGGEYFAGYVTEKALSVGADGLVLLSAGAGGQTGWVNGMSFVRAVRAFYDGPIVLSGGISDGAALWAARALGCDLGMMGTRFIATAESMAVDGYKSMLVDSRIDDVMLTQAFTGLDTNMLRPSIVASGLDPKSLSGPVTPERARELFGEHDRYAPGLDEDTVAHHLAHACGVMGRGCDYLFDTVAHLRDLGIRDRHLESLEAKVRAYCEVAAAVVPAASTTASTASTAATVAAAATAAAASTTAAAAAAAATARMPSAEPVSALATPDGSAAPELQRA
jgi:NAD(P)H-dependent flavin oxidoreductase YrpB (nitropropane dioxygenase family)